SGTNQFHGSGFLYDRNNKWGTRNPLAFNSLQTSPGVFDTVPIKPVDVRYQFGGTIGGPIKKDKAFFFFSYDQQRRNFPGLSRFTQSSFLNTADRCLLTTAAGTAVTTITLTATYNDLKWNSPAGIQTQATNTRARDNFGDDFVRARFLNVRLASTLRSTLLNEFRFQWGRDFEYEFSQPPLPGEPNTSVGGRSPQTFLTNGFSFGIPEFLERPAFPDERRKQF